MMGRRARNDGSETGELGMMGRRARIAFSLLHPLSSSKQATKSLDHEQKVIDKEMKNRQFSVGESIFYWNEFHKAWKKGEITKLEGSKVFVVQGENGETTKHLDRIVKTTNLTPQAYESPGNPIPTGSEVQSTANRDNSVDIGHVNKVALDQDSCSKTDQPSVPDKSS